MENLPMVMDSLKTQSDQFKNIMLTYHSALKELETKLSIINNELQYMHKYNPIEHIKSRLKSPESIKKKLDKKGLELTYENIVAHINDVAGIRIICSFIPDIYTIVDMIDRCEGITVLTRKDYIQRPKESGYASYHLVVSIPVSFSTGVIHVNAEIQIRTVAMDFWASLEHKIKYKFSGEVPDMVAEELRDCAQVISRLDTKMLCLSDIVAHTNVAQEL